MNQFRLYIRQAHVVMQLFVLIGLTLLGLGLMSSMGLLAAETFFQADIETINTYIQNPSLPGAVAPLKLLQICTTIGIFLLPAMTFSQFYSNRPERFLQLNRTPALPIVLATGALIIGFTPITDGLTWLNNNIHLPGFLSGFEEQMHKDGERVTILIGSFLAMDSFGDFIYNLFLLAVLPAIAEEFFFRGVIQELLIRYTRRIHLSVWVTGLAFGIMHGQFFSVIPLWILGALLGYLKEWTGNLWTAIIAHFVNNGAIVVIMYFFHFNLTDIENMSTPTTLFLIAGIVMSGALIYWFYRKRVDRPDDFHDLNFSEEPNQDSGI
jgi:membrane protease YdiL (CAAX protease family)